MAEALPATPVPGPIVCKVLGLFRRGDSVLALHGVDPRNGHEYHRPLGGTIEFGESSAEALVREMREELAAEVTDLDLLGVLEVLYRFDGRDRHEIHFVYDLRFVDPAHQAAAQLQGLEADGSPIEARWVSLADARAGRVRLVPEGLIELIDRRR